jgi:eukaryotic-like serine/threonine-protein kinase
MTQTLSCPQGHHWPANGNGSPSDSDIYCPVCGLPVKSPARLDATLCNVTPAPARPVRPLAAVADTTLGPDDDQHTGRALADGPSIDLDVTLQKPVDSANGPTSAVVKDNASTAGTYEILELLGRGGMGVVYKARQLGLNRLVALKMILAGTHASAEDRIRFQIEAEAVAEMQHPNIVQVYDIGTRDGYPYLSLEYLGGGTLQTRLAADRPAPEESARILEHLALAIHFAHQRGIVHRDLKPANILFQAHGEPSVGFAIPKITDFGLAKRIDCNRDHTQSGSILGTPNYMSPEQADGGRIGPATDIFALGAIFYDMLTGQPPFTGATVVETLDKVRHQEAIPPRRLNPKIPRDLETICLKCLEKAPARRYATAQDLADDLHRFLHHEPIQARPVSPTERCAKWLRRHPTRAALIGLSVLMVLGAFAWVVQQWQHAEAQHRAAVERRREEKLKEAESFIKFMDEMRELYSDAVLDRVKGTGIEVTPYFKDKMTGAIPVWATFVHELSDRIEKQGRGQHTRLYSDYPWRKGGGPRDEFEQRALQALRQDKEKPYYRFEEYQGRPSLRYAAADVMHKACVDCHNTQPGTPKNDWKIGDVRGVLEVVLPLD